MYYTIHNPELLRKPSLIREAVGRCTSCVLVKCDSHCDIFVTLLSDETQRPNPPHRALTTSQVNDTTKTHLYYLQPFLLTKPLTQVLPVSYVLSKDVNPGNPQPTP